MDWGDCTIELSGNRVDFDSMNTEGYVCWRIMADTASLAREVAIVLADLSGGDAYYEANGAGRAIN